MTQDRTALRTWRHHLGAVRTKLGDDEAVAVAERAVGDRGEVDAGHLALLRVDENALPVLRERGRGQGDVPPEQAVQPCAVSDLLRHDLVLDIAHSLPDLSEG